MLHGLPGCIPCWTKAAGNGCRFGAVNESQGCAATVACAACLLGVVLGFMLGGVAASACTELACKQRVCM